MEKESFNYTISSDDRVNTDANQIYYDIDFGNTMSHYDNYKIEVVNCIMNGAVVEDNGYLILVCEGLHDNGIFCRNLLNSNECVICTIPTNLDVLMSNGGIVFNASNCRISKRIRFKLLLPSFVPVTSGSDINVGGVQTRWLLTLRLTPLGVH